MSVHRVSSVTSSVVLSVESDLRATSLRRSLRAELAGIDAQIRQSGLRDAMTQTIAIWGKNFQDALKTSADVEHLLAVHIALLQDALRDPITHAPLDQEAVLGSDGHAYGRLALSVYRRRTPPQLRMRSPLDPTNPALFTTSPHPVVQHMTGWLQSHNALLHSEELKREYLAHLPPEPPSSEERIARLLSKRREREQSARERPRELSITLNTQALHSFEEALDAMFTSFVDKREQATASVMADLDRISARDQKTYAALQQQLSRETEQRVSDVLDLGQRQQALSEEFTDRTRAIAEQHLNVEEEMRATADVLNQLIVERANSAIFALRGPIKSYHEQVEAAILSMAERVEEGHLHLQHEVDRMRGEIAQLREQNARLGHCQTQIEVQLNVCREEQQRLQHSIEATQAAIQELRQSSSDSLFKAVAIIGACAFTTWTLSMLLSSSAIAAAPMSTGFGIKIMIPI